MRKILYIYGQLSDLDVEWIKNNAIKEKVGPGTVIITENESINKLILIIRGKFSVTSKRTGEKEIALLKSGEMLGEMSFIENLPPLEKEKVLNQLDEIKTKYLTLSNQYQKN